MVVRGSALSALINKDEIVEKGKNVHDWITDNLGFGNPWIGYSLAAGGLLTGGMLINKGVKSISNKIFNRTSKKVGKEVVEEVAEGAAKKTIGSENRKTPDAWVLYRDSVGGYRKGSKSCCWSFF